MATLDTRLEDHVLRRLTMLDWGPLQREMQEKLAASVISRTASGEKRVKDFRVLNCSLAPTVHGRKLRFEGFLVAGGTLSSQTVRTDKFLFFSNKVTTTNSEAIAVPVKLKFECVPTVLGTADASKGDLDIQLSYDAIDCGFDGPAAPRIAARDPWAVTNRPSLSSSQRSKARYRPGFALRSSTPIKRGNQIFQSV